MALIDTLALVGTAVGTAAAEAAPAAAAVGSAVGDVGAGIAAGLTGSTAGAGTSAILPGLSTIASAAMPTLATTALGQGITGIQGAQANSQNQAAGRNAATNAGLTNQVQSAEARQTGSGVWGHAAGGPVALQNGDWVVPADVLSSIGNGSTKAGAQFLNDYFGLNDDGQGSPT